MATHTNDSPSVVGDSRTSRHARAALSADELAHLALVVLPPLLLLMLLAVGIWSWQANRNRLQWAIAALAADGEPVGNDSLAAAYDRRTEPAASQEWREVFAAIGELDSRLFPYVLDKVGQTDELVPSDQHWPPSPIAERYARESQPIVRRIEQLTHAPQPVWQPLIVDGFSTLLPELQAARSVPRLLHHRFRHAFHQGDHELALSTIELVARVPDVFDWRVALTADLVYFALTNEHREMIRESMAHDFWTAEELRRLDSLLQRREDLDAHWQQSIAANRALMLAETQPGVSRGRYVDEMAMLPFGVPADARLNHVRRTEQMQMLRGAGTKRHVRETAELQENIQYRVDVAAGIADIPLADPSSVIDFLFPAWSAYSASFVRHEMERRWTRCAVAIKRFELQEDRWPSSLRDLAQVGLSPAGWHAVEGVPFGYQVSEDGDEAVLWTVEPGMIDNEHVEISPTPPSEDERNSERLEMLEIHIR